MNNQIVDLILPNSNTSVDITIREQVEYYLDKNMTPAMRKAYNHIDGDILSIVMCFIDDLKAIKDQVVKENKVNYNREFWIKVEELNQNILRKIKRSMLIYQNDVFFGGNYYKFNEIDLINKQYRLLQEIYYSRLEDNNE